MNILDRIVAVKREEVAALRRDGWPVPEMDLAPRRDFRASLEDDPDKVAVIAEIKKASPSKGLICADFNPEAIAADYEKGGARAISVLTDSQFFKGDIAYLARIRAVSSLPILRKDFIIHPCQIEQAKACGADAILLITAILDSSQLRDYRQMAEEMGLASLVEVHDRAEMETAIASGAGIIGVNNRNLKDFSLTLETTEELAAMLSAAHLLVSESGIFSRDDVARVQSAGARAVLVGESLMRAADRPGAVRDLIGMKSEKIECRRGQ